MNKVFLLGVGAQKGGTTWLANYLATSQGVASNGIKEYHVWDALHLPLCRKRLVSAEDSRRDFRSAVTHALQQAPAKYFDYFDEMLKAKGAHTTFDITPSYCGLGRDVYGTIIAGFAAKDIATRAIFLMRDPVERCWSSARNTGRRKGGNTDVSEEQFIAHAQSAEAGMRTRYADTVRELEASFPASDLFFGLHEDMFEAENVLALSAFCGVTPRPALAEERIFSSPKTRPLAEDAMRKVALHYRDVYDFAAARFPRVTALWGGYRYL